MRVTRHLPSNQIHCNYTLHQQTLEQVRSAKYLELTITDNFEWDQHVFEISCKATKTLGILRRNLALTLRHTKKAAYKALFRPQLLFGILIITLRQRWRRKYRRHQPGGPTGDGRTSPTIGLSFRSLHLFCRSWTLLASNMLTQAYMLLSQDKGMGHHLDINKRIGTDALISKT